MCVCVRTEIGRTIRWRSQNGLFRQWMGGWRASGLKRHKVALQCGGLFVAILFAGCKQCCLKRASHSQSVAASLCHSQSVAAQKRASEHLWVCGRCARAAHRLWSLATSWRRLAASTEQRLARRRVLTRRSFVAGE